MSHVGLQALKEWLRCSYEIVNDGMAALRNGNIHNLSKFSLLKYSWSLLRLISSYVNKSTKNIFSAQRFKVGFWSLLILLKRSQWTWRKIFNLDFFETILTLPLQTFYLKNHFAEKSGGCRKVSSFKFHYFFQRFDIKKLKLLVFSGERKKVGFCLFLALSKETG